VIQQYLKELSKVQLLSQLEEKLLWDNYKNKNSLESRQRLIESYQPLVFKIASRITSREELFFDLIQEGTVGLIEAVEKYNLHHDVKFSTFAQYRIRGRIIDYLRNHRTSQEALELALQQDEFQDVLSLIADSSVNVEEEVSFNLIAQQVRKAISRLNSKEQKVINDLYLLDKEPVALAEKMNISLSYIYKLQKKALQRLRGMLSKLRSEMKSGS